MLSSAAISVELAVVASAVELAVKIFLVIFRRICNLQEKLFFE